MALLSNFTRIRSIRRFGKISGVLVHHGFGDVVDRMFNRGDGDAAQRKQQAAALSSNVLSPGRFRKVLEELGPSFIKLGQLMSTRADVLPPAYIEELKKLQDQVPPVPYDAIQPLVESELGQPMDDLFYSFTREPIAAASVAQVYRAELYTGETVAVKVIRPGIDKTVQDDIRLMYYFARRFEKSFALGQAIGAVNIVKEFERTIFRELDLLIEAGIMEKFAANFEDDNEIIIPTVHWDLTTTSVLVMDFIDGMNMDNVDAIRDSGTDPRDVALIGLRSFSRQLMEFGLFHADPHPANTLVLKDGRVGLVDFGIIGYLDEEVMRQIAFVLLGFAEHDYDMVMEALLDAGLIDTSRVDLRSFRADLKDVSEPFYGRRLQNISVKDVYDQIMQLIYEYRIQLPRNLLLLLKTFIQTEALGKILGSDASLLEVTRPYARRLLQKGYDAKKLFKNLGFEARGIAGQMRMMPRFMHDIFRRTAEGRHRMELRHTGLEAAHGKMEKAVNRLIVCIVIASSTIAGSLVLNVSHSIFEVPVHALGISTVPLIALLGVTGYCIATILGVWLIISIIRSGKL